MWSVSEYASRKTGSIWSILEYSYLKALIPVRPIPLGRLGRTVEISFYPPHDQLGIRLWHCTSAKSMGREASPVDRKFKDL